MNQPSMAPGISSLRQRRARPMAEAPLPPKPEECIERAYQRLKLCHNLLTAPTPSALISCAAVLNQIADDLEILVRGDHTAPAETVRYRERILQVQEELVHANTLMQQAGVFYQGWIRMLAPYLRGYTRTGMPAALTCEGQLLLQI